MIGSAPICLACVHYNSEEENDFSCAAFPDGIPEIIIRGNPHTSPIKGDHGIRFTPLDKSKTAADVLSEFGLD